jgi:hypothetical protein
VQRALFHQDDRGHRDGGKRERGDEHPAEHFGDVGLADALIDSSCITISNFDIESYKRRISV